MKRIIIAVCLTSILLLCFGCDKNSWLTIDILDYFDIMSDIGQDIVPPNPDVDPPDLDEEFESAPTLPGFTPVGKLYDATKTTFIGALAIVKINDTASRIFYKDYSYRWTADKGNIVSCRDGKFIAEKDGQKLLCRASDGAILLQGNYDSIEYQGDTALAKYGDYTDIYYKSALTVKKTVRKLEIVKDGWLYDTYEQWCYGVTEEKLTANGLAVVLAESDGLIGVRNEKGLYGYVYDTGETCVVPKYTKANRFYNGFAIVHDGASCIIIDKRGEEILRIEIGEATIPYDGYIFLKSESNYQLRELSSFNEVFLPHNFIPYKERVFGNFCIDALTKTIFDITQGEPLPLQCASIEAIDDGNFLVTDKSGKYILYSDNFTKLISESEEISYVDGMYRILKNDDTGFFQKFIPRTQDSDGE